MGFALPDALLRPRCALTAPFHPYLTVACPAVLFSVALSVKFTLSESPRPLAGMLPYGDRTCLPPPQPFGLETGDCPSGRSNLHIARNRALVSCIYKLLKF